MIYIGSPYTHTLEMVMQERYEMVTEFCARCAIKGHFVYSPIAHWHPIAVRHNLPRDYKWWEELDKDILSCAKEMWVLRLDGWNKSKGLLREIVIALRNGIRVTYVSLDDQIKKKGDNEECTH